MDGAGEESGRRITRRRRNAAYDAQNVQHPFTGLHFTDKGLDYLEQYIAEVRDVIGTEIPLAIDHVGHISLQNGIRLARRPLSCTGSPETYCGPPGPTPTTTHRWCARCSPRPTRTPDAA
mgnify:CR=1 FL=1